MSDQDDLIAILRDLHEENLGDHCQGHYEPDCVICSAPERAADEIERLRAEIEQLKCAWRMRLAPKPVIWRTKGLGKRVIALFNGQQP